MLPRYFLARTEPCPAPAARGPLLLHVLDVIRLGASERAVVVDRSGALHLVAPADLPAALVPELHHHELVARGEPRLLDAAELWLLAVQLLEQPGDPPGLDDPITLSGRLYGPFPSGAPLVAEGTLSVTRSEVLDGFVRAAKDGFSLPTEPPARCLHALLPGDRAEVVARGDAVILAYPLVPSDLMLDDAGNELLVATLVHAVLEATREDAIASGVAHPLVEAVIPVPSREDLERELDAQGWDVHGDVAIKRSDATKKGTIGGVLASVLGVPDEMKRALPPEGTVDELLALAERILPSYQGFPSARITATRARVVRGRRPPPPPQVAPPHVPPPPRMADPSARRGPELSKQPTPADDWRKDFAIPAAPPARSAPRVTPLTEPKRAPARPSRPKWMDDFDDGS